MTAPLDPSGRAPRVGSVAKGNYLDAFQSRPSLDRHYAPLEASHRFPFPQACPAPARAKPEEPEDRVPAEVATTTRPQPKLPSDRRLEQRKPGASTQSPGNSSATYSPQAETGSPAFLLKEISSSNTQDFAEEVPDEPAFGQLGGYERSAPSQPGPKRSASNSSTSRPSEDAKEITYLKKNVDHLRFAKRRLEEKVQDLEGRCNNLEQRKQQYKLLYEHASRDLQAITGGGLEISSLHQQLSAVSLLKDALNQENMDLTRRLEEAQQSRVPREEASASQQAVCVICMDNLANVVGLPCKHLAMCTFCGQQQDIAECPICRSKLLEKMQIFTP